MNVHLLAKVPLFKDLPASELEHLAATLRVREVPPNTTLIHEGEVGDYIYIVVYGEVEVIKAMGTPEERLVGVRGPGEFIGELSLINPGGRRTASVRTQGPAQLLEMTHSDFDILLHQQPGLALQIVSVLGQRLIGAHNASIHDLQEKNRLLKQAYEELKAAQEQLIEKERLEREIQLGYEIQMSILPQTLPRLEGFDFGARIIPARTVGGDFFDVIKLNKDKAAIVIGDVADKGVPSAIYMARIHALISAEATHHATPGEVLRSVNYHLMKIHESTLFVTVLYGVLDRKTGEFVYARAGHELPILFLKEEPARLPLWKEGQLLGVLEKPVIDEQTLTIPPGGTMLLYTDGITEARNPVGVFFGMDRLLTELGKLKNKSGQEVCDRLLASLAAFREKAHQEDDVTLVAVHAKNTMKDEKGNG
jgi:serine phosphatase RsbU (regulator of sigma subunit)